MLQQFSDKEIPIQHLVRFMDLRQTHGPTIASLKGCEAASMSLKMLGQCLEDAAPWVYIESSKKAASHIRRYLQGPMVVHDFQPHFPTLEKPRFDFYFHPKSPPFRNDEFVISTGSSHIDDAREDFTIWCDRRQLEQAPTLSGLTILVKNGDRLRCATLGGLLQLERGENVPQHLGLTAGHIFMEEAVESSDESDDGDDGFCNTINGVEYRLDEDALNQTANKSHSYSTTSMKELVSVGKLYSASHHFDLVDRLDYDWALIEIDTTLLAKHEPTSMKTATTSITLGQPPGSDPDCKVRAMDVMIRNKLNGTARGDLSNTPVQLSLTSTQPISDVYSLTVKWGNGEKTRSSIALTF